MLELANIRKVFNQGQHNEYWALKGIDLEIPPARVSVLKGPSGSGKTTLLTILGCLARPTEGRVRLNGEDISGLPERFLTEIRRRTFGFIFQQFNLIRGLSALDNVALAVQGRPDAGGSFRFWQPVRGERWLFDEARGYLDQVGLGGRGDALAGNLAHGEQRALELAMALATKPRLLLLDEPMAGTGQEESARMVELIGHLARHVTILLVEHDMDAVFRLAGRISVLVDGRLIATGAPEAVRADPEVRRAYLGDHL